MIKLYKKTDGKWHYWETWESDEEAAIMHWGMVGDKGQVKEVKSNRKTNYEKVVQREYSVRIENGYAELEDDDLVGLEIRYKIEGLGTPADLDKRHDLEDALNEILGWNGLGHVEGGSIGSDSMEVGCMVVDFELAKSTIEKDLKHTKFADYSAIVKMK